MKDCFVKDRNCTSTSSCMNATLHTINKQLLLIVKWKANSPIQICNRHFEKKNYFQKLPPSKL